MRRAVRDGRGTASDGDLLGGVFGLIHDGLGDDWGRCDRADSRRNRDDISLDHCGVCRTICDGWRTTRDGVDLGRVQSLGRTRSWAFAWRCSGYRPIGQGGRWTMGSGAG